MLHFTNRMENFFSSLSHTGYAASQIYARKESQNHCFSFILLNARIYFADFGISWSRTQDAGCEYLWVSANCVKSMKNSLLWRGFQLETGNLFICLWFVYIHEMSFHPLPFKRWMVNLFLLVFVSRWWHLIFVVRILFVIFDFVLGKCQRRMIYDKRIHKLLYFISILSMYHDIK